MKPTKTIEDRFAVLLASDTNTLAVVSQACRVHLITSPFVPGRVTNFSTLTEATFTGATAKQGAAGTQQSFTDPLTGDTVVQLLEPAGGWHWQASVAPAEPQTVVGYCVTDADDVETFGSDLLPTPVVITDVGDAVDIGNVRFNIPSGVVS